MILPESEMGRFSRNSKFQSCWTVRYLQLKDAFRFLVMLKCQSILESMKEYLLFMGTAMFLECMALLSFTNLENYQPSYLKYCL